MAPSKRPNWSTIVGSAGEATLHGSGHLAVLLESDPHEVGVPRRLRGPLLGRGTLLRPPVGEQVRHDGRLVDRDRLQHHHRRVVRQPGDDDVGKDVLDGGDHAVEPPLGGRHVAQRFDPAEGERHATVATAVLDDVDVVVAEREERLPVCRLDVIPLEEALQEHLPVDVDHVLVGAEQLLLPAEHLGKTGQRRRVDLGRALVDEDHATVPRRSPRARGRWTRHPARGSRTGRARGARRRPIDTPNRGTGRRANGRNRAQRGARCPGGGTNCGRHGPHRRRPEWPRPGCRRRPWRRSCHPSARPLTGRTAPAGCAGPPRSPGAADRAIDSSPRARARWSR